MAKKKRTPKKQIIYNKTNRRCFYCGNHLSLNMDDDNHMTIDHVIPKSKGGDSHIDNLVASCKSCNSAKCNKSIDEFRMMHAIRKRFKDEPVTFNKAQIEWIESHGLDLDIVTEKFYGEK